MDLVARAKGLLLTPESEWRAVAAEPADPRRLYTGYAMILSAIPPLAALIGLSVFGISFAGRTVRLGVGSLLGQAIVQYVLGLVAIYVVSLIINFLSPKFGGVDDRLAALKLSVFAPTAAWLAGVFSLIPALSVLAILGLWSIYTFYVGLPILMRCPRDRVLLFMGAIVLCYLVLVIVVGVVAGAVVGIV